MATAGGRMVADWPIPELLGEETVVGPKTRFARVGAPVTKLHLIVTGVVGRFVAVGGDGDEVLDATRTEGWLLGAVPAMTTGLFEVGLVALTQCTLRAMSVASFNSARKRADVLAWLAQMHATDLAADAGRKSAVARGGARAVLEEFLGDLFRADVRPVGRELVRLTVEIRPTDVGRLIGVSRETASRLLADLEADGYVIKRKGWLCAPAASPLLRTREGFNPRP